MSAFEHHINSFSKTWLYLPVYEMQAATTYVGEIHVERVMNYANILALCKSMHIKVLKPRCHMASLFDLPEKWVIDSLKQSSSILLTSVLIPRWPHLYDARYWDNQCPHSRRLLCVYYVCNCA